MGYEPFDKGIFITRLVLSCSEPFQRMSPELTAVEKVDQTLLKNDSGVESALLYAKAWSKYTKDVLAYVEKRLSLGEPQTKLALEPAASLSPAEEPL